ncbi:MAG: plasminogen-binding N-terminal domain-containing protein [Campylobacterota bacterium]
MKLIIAFLVFTISLLALEPSQATVIAVDGDKITLDRSYEPGVSGIVYHAYDKSNSAIVATVAAQGGREVQIVKTQYVKNDKLPDIATQVRPGDSVIMGYLYNRSLLITPNEQTYKQVLNLYPSMDFINPDLLAFQLMQEGQELPDKSSIQTYCAQNAIGLVYLVAADMGYFIDANSFEVLSVEPIDSSGDRMMPFFMRLEKLDAGLLTAVGGLYKIVKAHLLDIDTSIEENYDKYYLYMMGE